MTKAYGSVKEIQSSDIIISHFVTSLFKSVFFVKRKKSYPEITIKWKMYEKYCNIPKYWDT